MAELINLNKARKARAKSEAKATAAQNRVRFGRTKADRDLQAARTDKATRELESNRREDD